MPKHINRTKQNQRPSPAFRTDRLNVYVMMTQAGDPEECYGLGRPAYFFVGFHRDEDWPAHVVTATVSTRRNNSVYDHPVYWLETRSTEHRQGYATEFCRGIEEYLGSPIHMEGATPAGEAFCESYEQEPVSPEVPF